MSSYQEICLYWKDRNISDDAQLTEILNDKGVLFAYHSSRIENDAVAFHDVRDIFDHDGVMSYTGDLQTLFELRNAKEAFEIFLIAFGEHRPFDKKLIKEFQYKLSKNTYDTRRWKNGERPGEYKKHDYETGKNEIGASPETVQEEMTELLDELQEFEPAQVLTAAPYFHAKFENIRPFADGNGRTGRLALNYLLILYNHPPIIIHEEDRREYFEALEAWDERQELLPLKEFLIQQTEKTWENI